MKASVISASSEKAASAIGGLPTYRERNAQIIRAALRIFRGQIIGLELRLAGTRSGRVVLHLATALMTGHVLFASAGIWREICRV